MKTDWPAINSLAWLRLSCCGAEHPTRVEDVTDAGDIVVGAPVAPHEYPVKRPEDDEAFFIGWATGNGAVEVPVVVDRALDEPVAMWDLKAVGEAVATQRRNFVRIEHTIEVKLHLLEGGVPPVTALTLDISEGGIRCQVDRWAGDPGGRRFDVEFMVEDKEVLVRAEVAWWGNLDANDRRLVGIRFVEIEQMTADKIRAFVFKTQIEQRRSRLE